MAEGKRLKVKKSTTEGNNPQQEWERVRRDAKAGRKARRFAVGAGHIQLAFLQRHHGILG